MIYHQIIPPYNLAMIVTFCMLIERFSYLYIFWNIKWEIIFFPRTKANKLKQIQDDNFLLFMAYLFNFWIKPIKALFLQFQIHPPFIIIINPEEIISSSCNVIFKHKNLMKLIHTISLIISLSCNLQVTIWSWYKFKSLIFNNIFKQQFASDHLKLIQIEVS